MSLLSAIRRCVLNCIVSAAEKQEAIKTWLTKEFKYQWTLMMNVPLAHCRSLVENPGDLLGTPLDDGTALRITSSHAHDAAAGEGRSHVAERHAREFLGQLNPTNQQISVNSLPPLVSSFLLGCCCLLHTCTHTSLPATAQVN